MSVAPPPPRGSTKSDRPIDSGGSLSAATANNGRHISSSELRWRTVSRGVAPERKATQAATSPSGAFHPPLGMVIPGSNSRPFSTSVSRPVPSRAGGELLKRQGAGAGAKLGHRGDDPLVERQAAGVPELHPGARRERLGDRGPMVDRALARRLVARAVGETAVVAPEHAPVAHHQRARPDDAVGVHVGVERPGERLPPRGRAASPRGPLARGPGREQDGTQACGQPAGTRHRGRIVRGGSGGKGANRRRSARWARTSSAVLRTTSSSKAGRGGARPCTRNPPPRIVTCSTITRP